MFSLPHRYGYAGHGPEFLMEGRMEKNRKDMAAFREAAELFDLPGDVVAGLPHVELIGNCQFYMERHRGILSYSREEIDINGETGIVRIFGRDLELTSMTGDQLRIQGSISRLEWVK